MHPDEAVLLQHLAEGIPENGRLLRTLPCRR